MSHVTTKSNTHMKIKDFFVQIYCSVNHEPISMQYLAKMPVDLVGNSADKLK